MTRPPAARHHTAAAHTRPARAGAALPGGDALPADAARADAEAAAPERDAATAVDFAEPDADAAVDAAEPDADAALAPTRRPAADTAVDAAEPDADAAVAPTRRPAADAAVAPTPRPALPPRRRRVADVVAAARRVVARAGLDGLTMQAVAAELRIKAPSLYKHVAGKRAIEVELIVDALAEIGADLHRAIAEAPAGRRTAALLAAYRRRTLAEPELYRLATRAGMPRDALPPGLEAWAGEPFRVATGDPYRGQALWAFAHGMVVLEMDGRFADASNLDTTWAAGAAAFT